VKQREEEYQPTREEIKAMCELADLETAAFILNAAESGQRDGTIADLTLSHVQECLGGEPYSFIVPQKRDAKTGKIVKSKRIYGTHGFLCKDAVEKLKLLIKTKNLKPEDKIFTHEAQAYSKNITDLAIKIGIAEPTGLRRFRTHNLRKRAQTIMEDSNVPLNWVDRILGHKPRGSQADAYSLPPKEKLAEKYKFAMPALEIYQTQNASSPKIEELEKRISQLEAIITKLA
jgi:integrase